MRNTYKIFLGFLLALVIVCLSLFWYIQYNLTPIQKKAVDFVIQENETIHEVANKLQNLGVIRNAKIFILYVRQQKMDRLIKAGEYHIEPIQSISQLITYLKNGQEKLIKYTIPEGYRIKKIAQTLAKQGIVNEKRFVELASHLGNTFEFRYKNQIKNGNLEGFLFPNTYLIARPTEEKIIEQMLGEFEKEVDETVLQNRKATKLTLHQLITLASVIEKEAQVSSERKTIASVFYNRMEIGMPLQSCATVEYALSQNGTEKEGYVLSLEELKIDSPFNTYKYAGLPPEPICNPGLSSILAALNPSKTDYFYFAAKGDGTHAFAKTLDEHNNNVAKYIH